MIEGEQIPFIKELPGEQLVHVPLERNVRQAKGTETHFPFEKNSLLLQALLGTQRTP
jgi:hypothetical protein